MQEKEVAIVVQPGWILFLLKKKHVVQVAIFVIIMCHFFKWNSFLYNHFF